jgi:ABC-type branched-subunit amino acid transport system substrate-binding protein
VSSQDCLPEERVAELVEGRLQGDALAATRRHLASCAECRELVASLANASPTEGTTEARSPALDATRPASLPEKGERVGRYVVQALIGSGAMGRVYAALDPSLDRRVALKLLRADVTVPDLESRLLREAKAMARIAHRHVVGVYEVGRHGDALYIAMELVEGGTLRDWLARAPRTWREVLDVFLGAGEGLAEAHAAGIIHRDFKPENVLVSTDGRTVRVTDFGLARAEAAADSVPLGEADTRVGSDPRADLESPLTRTGALVGTPRYMAPEQHGSATIDARADLYAFCVALYEGLFDEQPFSGGNLLALHAAKSAEKVRRARRESRVPSRLRRVVLSGLRADPAQRPATMAALLAELRRAARPLARRWAGALGAAVVLTAVVAIGMEARTRSGTRGAPVAGSAAAEGIAASACSNAACAKEHGGAPWVCSPKTRACAPVEDDRCKAYYEPGDLEANDTVWLGALLPMSGPIADVGKSNQLAVELARRELAEATRPFTGPNASLQVRHVAVAVCDDGPTEGVMASAEHLVDDVGVPAIFGFRSGQEVADLAGALLIQRGVVSVVTLSPSALVTQIPQRPDSPRMVWRTTPGIEDAATGISAFVRDSLEPHRSGAGPTRVALLRTAAPGSIAFAQALLKSLTFNGKSAIDNGEAYREIGLAREGADDIAAAARRVIDETPAFVVVQLGPASSVPTIKAVEAGWPAAIGRPIYLIALDVLEPFADVLSADAHLRRRVLAVNSDSSSASNAHFVVRFNEANASAQVSRTWNPGSSYDALYLLAYAANAAPPRRVDGPGLVEAFARLEPGGRRVEVGPTGVFEALSELALGHALDLDGATSSLDFDRRTGEVAADYVINCLAVDSHGRAKSVVEAGPKYVAATGRVVGQLRCP